MYNLKDQCVRLTGIYWQRESEMKCNIHNYIFISVYSPENKNCVFVTLEVLSFAVTIVSPAELHGRGLVFSSLQSASLLHAYKLVGSL